MQTHGHDGDTDHALDQMLDAAIAAYADPAETPQPRPFAARVMASVQDAAPRGRGWWGGLAIGAPVLAALVIAAVILLRMPRTPQIAYAPKAPAVFVPAARAYVTAIRVAAQVKHARRPETNEWKVSKLEQFPSPQPLNEQERLLVAFAEHAPQSAKDAVIASQKQISEPLHIATIEIPSLDTTPLTQNDRFLPAAYPASSTITGTRPEPTNRDIQP